MIRRRAISARSLAAALSPRAWLSSRSSSARRCSTKRVRSLKQPVIEGNADPVELFQQIALTISCELAAMRALCELGRQYSQRIDPAVGGLERDGLAIRGDQLVGERTERNDQFAERLAEARARLKVRHAVPQHRGKAAARQTLAGSDTEATKNCARLAPAWQNVAAQIGRRPHRPENLDSRDRVGRWTVQLRCADFGSSGMTCCNSAVETRLCIEILCCAGPHYQGLRELSCATIPKVRPSQKRNFTDLSRMINRPLPKVFTLDKRSFYIRRALFTHKPNRRHASGRRNHLLGDSDARRETFPGRNP